MANTHPLLENRGIQVLIAGSIVTGVAVLLLGTMRDLQANLTGQGAVTPIALEQTQGTTETKATLRPMEHAAAPIAESGTAAVSATIILGVLLIATGLLLHAVLLLGYSPDRRVPVHVAEHSHATIEREARSQRAIEVYWMEQEIRL